MITICENDGGDGEPRQQLSFTSGCVWRAVACGMLWLQSNKNDNDGQDDEDAKQ